MRTLNEYFLYGSIADISTADQIYIPVPDGGRVVAVYSAIETAITVADAILTPKINGTAITNGAVTVAFTGAAAGDVDSSFPTAANSVSTGEAVEIETDGGSTTASQVDICVVIRR